MKNVPPKVSVIIPTYNRPNLVLKAISSVIESSKKCGLNVDIVVVNDGSNIEYEILLRRFSKEVTYIENEIRKGISHARNVGLINSRFDWVVFLDDDDYFLPGYFGALLNSISREPDSKVFFTGATILSSDFPGGETDRVFSSTERRHKIIKDFLSIGMGFGIAVHKEVFDRVGVFDTSFLVAEDTEFFFRMIVFGYFPSLLPGINVVKDERHKDRLSTSFKLYSDLNVYDRIFDRYELHLAGNLRYNYIHMLMWAYRLHRKYRNIPSEALCLSKLRELGIPESHIDACYIWGDDIADEYTLV